jgi:hypothetical protein
MGATDKSSGAGKADAIALLIDDHKKVKKLFKDFEKVKEGNVEEKVALVQQTLAELKVHTTIEEEIFYPAVRAVIDDDDLMNEAEVEHDSAKDLIGQIESMEPEDPMYDARFSVLGEYVNHHVEEEQEEMFAKVKKAKLDLMALGNEMLTHKQSLMTEMEEQSAGDDNASRAGSAKSSGKKKAKQSA